MQSIVLISISGDTNAKERKQMGMMKPWKAIKKHFDCLPFSPFESITFSLSSHKTARLETSNYVFPKSFMWDDMLILSISLFSCRQQTYIGMNTEYFCLLKCNSRMRSSSVANREVWEKSVCTQAKTLYNNATVRSWRNVPSQFFVWPSLLTLGDLSNLSRFIRWINKATALFLHQLLETLFSNAD